MRVISVTISTASTSTPTPTRLSSPGRRMVLRVFGLGRLGKSHSQKRPQVAADLPPRRLSHFTICRGVAGLV